MGPLASGRAIPCGAAPWLDHRVSADRVDELRALARAPSVEPGVAPTGVLVQRDQASSARRQISRLL